MERVAIDRPLFFESWLGGIARNKALHWIRRRKVEETASGDLTRHARTERSAFREAISQEALDLFDREIRRLTKAQRQALLLRIIDHLSFDEIGVRMRMRAGAARALVFRARGRLTGWLDYMRAL
jgi:RNA polymerase sigma factor (sigma-70 family)